MLKLLSKSIQPKSKNKATNRKEYIFNILILSVITICFIADLILLYRLITTGLYFQGIFILWKFIIYIVLLFLFIFLYYLSRIGRITISVYIFIALLSISTLKTLYLYGFHTTSGFLTCALIIIIAQILTTKKFTAYLTLFITFFISITGYLQINKKIITYNWEMQPLSYGDITMYSLLLFIILIVSWLYNREIEKSYSALQKERDLLDTKVKERTSELKREQTKRVSELYRFYEFGQLSAGIFHDLINKLSVVSLTMGQLKSQRNIASKASSDVQKLIDQASKSVKNMEKFIEAAQKQVKQGARQEVFSIIEEIRDCILIMQYKAKKENVCLEFAYQHNTEEDIKIYGDKFKFNQILANLSSNAIDAYQGLKKKDKKCKVIISTHKTTGTVTITIQDWGKGISPRHLNEIFNPFFSTKGTLGLGLSTTKKIVEKGFNGKIKVESEEKHGTTFILNFPIHKE